MKKILLIFVLVVSLFGGEDIVLSSANAYLNTIKANQNSPFSKLSKQAKAVIIFPNIKKVGFVVGGMAGDGVMIVNPQGERELISVSISGGSFGVQVGYENSSLVLFILKDQLVEDINESKFTINTDASFSYGDGGRNVQKTTDINFTSDIYAYAANAGFFAGASFGGAMIDVRDENILQSGYAYDQLVNAILK
ncbi:MAG: lipid-binding SYLF domain-containing protein [Campylobacter sp.]|nr:lipid-binding SYLF domain-containing protein [Campylobacter sp.]